MRRCSRCKREKPLEEFNLRNKETGLRQYQCKECSRFYLRSHYERNKQYYLLKASKRNKVVRNEIKTYIWEYFSNHPCVDCHEKDPIVLEFDHISNKSAEISTMYRNFTLEQVKKEIEKCEVRCANCHRRKTAKQFGWHKTFMPL